MIRFLLLMLLAINVALFLLVAEDEFFNQELKASKVMTIEKEKIISTFSIVITLLAFNS